MPSSRVALCKCKMSPLSYEGAVLLSSLGSSVSCGCARVLVLHTHGAKVAVLVVVGTGVGIAAVVMGAAGGAVAGVVWSEV